MKLLLKRIVDWRAVPRLGWYVLAITLPPGVMAASYAVMVLLGRSLPEPRFAVVEVALLFGVFLIAAVCEEACSPRSSAMPPRTSAGPSSPTTGRTTIWS
ncbi:hypothetical protein [Microbispora hainanensis]|uniref:Uncharacterized protein n=1 Tax=Microbispora hainanensis TaxID=568844 RepID=A0A544Y4N6_9ACTN|nr:hypothetical protein [Microbispora hainanensis]TQS11723.1 hypothetical protein FLX08_36905 [Microbispora hainanensis]